MQQDERSTTGTIDKNFGLVSVLYHSIKSAEDCEQYKADAADDEELADFFEGVCEEHRQRAIRVKSILMKHISNEDSDIEDVKSQGSGRSPKSGKQPEMTQ